MVESCHQALVDACVQLVDEVKMTATRYAMNAYGQAAETMPPARQIVMLYDGVIRFLGTARQAIDEGRIQDRHVAIAKASAIIEALHGCLDHQKGGEIALGLDRIYTHVITRLQTINLTNNPAICEDLAQRLGAMREGWATIANGQADKTTPTASPLEPATPLSLPSALTT